MAEGVEPRLEAVVFVTVVLFVALGLCVVVLVDAFLATKSFTQEVMTFIDKIHYCRMWQQWLTRHLEDNIDCTCGIDDEMVTAIDVLDHFWIQL